jgi:protein involved in polysaccharide export with SLBB domain
MSARVRPGDKITLHFLRERELSESLTVNERGEAAFPKLGIISVSRMTIGELQDTLRTRYSEFLRMPELEIAVLRRVTVNGEVRIPNVYLVDGASTVRDVIARAGGITESGSRNKVDIMRSGERIPVREWERSQGLAMDIQSGDQIIVGRKNWLVINALPAASTAVLVTSFVIGLMRR